MLRYGYQSGHKTALALPPYAARQTELIRARGKESFPSRLPYSCIARNGKERLKNAADFQVEARRCFLRNAVLARHAMKGFLSSERKKRSQHRRIKGKWSLPSSSCPEQPLSLVHPYEVIAGRQGSRSNDAPSVNQAISFVRGRKEDSIFLGPR